MAKHLKPAQLPGGDPDPTGAMVGKLALILSVFTLMLLDIGQVAGGIVFGLMALICLCFWRPSLLSAAVESLRAGTASEPPPAPLSAQELRSLALTAGGGCYLAGDHRGHWYFAPASSAVLVLAGPRAGKTSCVVIPALSAHPGPAVATSTKTEVLDATLQSRRTLGAVWFFDLDGHGAPPGTQQLRWSPVTRAADWQQAQLLAEAMTGASTIDADGAHWSERASALIACCLHAAALSHQGMRELTGWILRHDTDSPLAELAPQALASDVLLGIKHTADRERSGIFSTAARVLRAYRSEVALAATEDPNFDAERFVASRDTIYIAAPAQHQALLAPIVVGALAEIRQATYRHTARHGPPQAPVLFMLDECANIAPIPDLPAMLSEAGGQGLQTVVVLQDMSQARRRWPQEADGMLSLFGARVILSGIADTKTLQQLSLLCGDWDRPIQTITHQQPNTLLNTSRSPASTSQSWTTRRERRLPPDQIAQLPRGQALVMIGPRWSLLPTLPHHQHPAFTNLPSKATPSRP